MHHHGFNTDRMPEPGHQVQLLRQRCSSINTIDLIKVAVTALERDVTLQSAIDYLEIDLHTFSGLSHLNWKLTKSETFMLIYLLAGDRVAANEEEARRPQQDDS